MSYLWIVHLPAIGYRRVRRSAGSQFKLIPNPSGLTYNDATSQLPYCSPAAGAEEWQCPLDQSQGLAQAQVEA